MDIQNNIRLLPEVDQGFEIIGTQKYLDKFTRINNCAYDDEKKKYEFVKKANEDRVKRTKDHPCMCAKEWRYEANYPLYYKGPIKPIDWKPRKYYCDDNSLVEDLKKLPNRVKIINNGIDNSNQDKLLELNRQYGYNQYHKNNVNKCNSQAFFDMTNVTNPKWGCDRTNYSMYGSSSSKEDYWHQLSEKKFLNKGDYKLCNAEFNNAPFSLGNYSTEVDCGVKDTNPPSNSLWNNMTKRKSLY